jgi:tRNA uridine 5-carboxymethylaminomethyl modification enzyme
MPDLNFDVAVVGGGHAGCEAAAAAARKGARVALVTFDRTTVGAMSCNPAIGGLGKGHLVREVDALDGLIGRAADAAAIHYRMLNSSKGAAVQGPRIQADRTYYKAAIQASLLAQPSLTIIEGEVASLKIESGEVRGLVLGDGSSVAAKAVVLATGTFLGGKMFRGDEQLIGGRIGERAATRMAQQLREIGLPMARLKTGTPPRLDGRTINWSVLQEQPSDDELWTMSPMSQRREMPQMFCAITRTNGRTHDIIRSSLSRSPLFSGAIEGQGPRYCPSIEDKIFRFGDRDGHQVFLEPESAADALVYPNGISTSLPTDVQIDMVRSMAGLERAEIVVPGYAVEYDHIDPRALDPTLSVRDLPNLFLAGQVNGTTGYEEAAAQGLMAGANAAALALGRDAFVLDRASSYIGVMIDDLVLQGVTEPYRMLTARAEYRLHLRADNATTRLTHSGISHDLVGLERKAWYIQRENARINIENEMGREITPNELRNMGVGIKADGVRRSLFEWSRFPEIDGDILDKLAPSWIDAGVQLRNEIIEDARYAPYLERQATEIRDLRSNERLGIPGDFDYSMVKGLSREMTERLNIARPATLAQASRIRGITPAALSAVMVHLRRSKKQAA